MLEYDAELARAEEWYKQHGNPNAEPWRKLSLILGRSTAIHDDPDFAAIFTGALPNHGTE